MNASDSKVPDAQVARDQVPFAQVDVFAEAAHSGNPLAVVADGSGLGTEEMQRFAAWTNLSETTFLLPPTDPEADYRVRIFTPVSELPFAGHPTLGTCQVWLDGGGVPQSEGVVVQQCDAGLVPISRSDADRLAFRAPPLMRSGPAEPDVLAEAVAAIGVDHDTVIDAAWIDNGPGWLGLLLPDAATVLALQPTFTDLKLGVIGPHPEGGPAAFEVRAFFAKDGAMVEDPVTGSLNASAAQWLIASGRAQAPYLATQGSAIGRDGRVHISVDERGDVWVGGAVRTVISGSIWL